MHPIQSDSKTWLIGNLWVPAFRQPNENGETNENGEWFAGACPLNQLVIGASVFPHKHIHKVAWISPEYVRENQIDHISIMQRYTREKGCWYSLRASFTSINDQSLWRRALEKTRETTLKTWLLNQKLLQDKELWRNIFIDKEVVWEISTNKKTKMLITLTTTKDQIIDRLFQRVS